jgi:hypothetical protein
MGLSTNYAAYAATKIVRLRYVRGAVAGDLLLPSFRPKVEAIQNHETLSSVAIGYGQTELGLETWDAS